MDLTVVINTYNEEENIADCISSAKLLSDDIIVIDMESVDKTTTLAKTHGAQIFSFHHSNYVEPGREFGISKAKTDWVFILDADERLTQELAKEINRNIKNQFLSTTHYRIPRKNVFGKVKWLKNGGWWPDYQVRLINKKHFSSWPKRIHSTPIVKGQIGYLKNPILHYFHGNIEKMVEKTIEFENIESDLLYNAKKEADVSTFFRKFIAEFTRRLIIKMGFLDGAIGFIESMYQAFSKTITYLFLYEKNRSKKT
ncbi:MAG: Lipopolysaccharide biosynthesis glycosyltransferase [Candidatus Roizmanbacteria bacterium GW2011_GWA2_35_19]|uniref:Lipopolysaccharide biosynthesis glycosyltransferase n=1 Tax=Candidatus Roizmanbacteria bacterium GW2011_GWA2_35_19 TaxID=1618478 RepID=A0A0G0BR32_9BACT|nr:MAG: Lipopolysaccharide biosynthesis glycosyltransferase [Candidatus Roizmanbacteria bacterium GW2011_GWA2_35_19]